MNVYSRQKIIFAKQYCLMGNGQFGFKFTEIPAKILQLNLKSITGFLSYFCQLKIWHFQYYKTNYVQYDPCVVQ